MSVKPTFIVAMHKLLSYIYFILVTIGDKDIDTSRTIRNKTRVYGGYQCNREQHKNIVQLKHQSKYFCAGTLISELWVLTAAHCLIVDKITVEGYGSDPDAVSEMLDYYIHPLYNGRTFHHDIGLLYLEEPIKQSEFINYINIPNSSISMYIDKLCPYALGKGWGETEDKVDKGMLLCVQLPVINISHCRYMDNNIIEDKAVCTLSEEGKDTCRGDSGGPLMCDDTQVGILSYGPQDCGYPCKPAVYTRVDGYLDFISGKVLTRRKLSASTSSLQCNTHTLFLISIGYCLRIIVCTK